MNQNLNGLLAGMAAALICILVIAIGFVVLWIFFCLSLQRTQTEVRPRNRLIPPGLVWLHLLHLGSIIPFVGSFISLLAAYVWDLIMVLKLGGSLEREYRSRDWRAQGGGYGKVAGLIWCGSGMAMSLLNVAATFAGQMVNTPEVAIGAGILMFALWLTAIICWIIYWVQMAGYGRKLREGKRGYRRGGVEDDYDDDMSGPMREYVRDRDDDFDDRPRRRDRDDDLEDDFDDRPRRRHREDD